MTVITIEQLNKYSIPFISIEQLRAEWVAERCSDEPTDDKAFQQWVNNDLQDTYITGDLVIRNDDMIDFVHAVAAELSILANELNIDLTENR